MIKFVAGSRVDKGKKPTRTDKDNWWCQGGGWHIFIRTLGLVVVVVIVVVVVVVAVVDEVRIFT